MHRLGPLRGVTRALAGSSALLVPPRCLACRRLTGQVGSGRLCHRCRIELERGAVEAPPLAPLHHLFVACRYEGAALRLVGALKRAAVPAAAEVAAELISLRLPAQGGNVIVPVPSRPLRTAGRGIDPALEIALALARLSGLGVDPCLRRLDRGRQRGRDRRRRLAEPPRFAATAPVPGEALLIDDVLTTGATLAAAARALHAAGCGRVDAAAFARSPGRRRSR